MAQAGFTPISLYYSTTASAVPTNTNLVAGELAINITDGKLYFKNNSNVVTLLASAAGASGDVVGPASATDNAIVRFDGTTGKLVQNSVVTIADTTGDISGVGQLNATTADLTNIEVTNIKAKDGTAAGSIADSTGLVTLTNLTGTTVDYTNLEVTNVKAKDGTASATIADTTGYWTFSGTGAFVAPKGTTGQQPGSSVTGMIRYNTTTNQFEGYSGSSPAWKSIGGSALSNDTSTASDLYPTFSAATTGTAENLYTSNAKLLYKPSTGEFKVSAPIASNGIMLNNTTVAASYTIAASTNGLSVGPITVDSGITVTVSSGQRWLVL